MTLLLSIDPGVRTAAALWYEGQLVHAQLFGGEGGQVHTCLEPVPAIVHVANTLALDTVVIEKPKIYDAQHQKGDQRDIVDLAVLVGALTQALAPYTQAILHVEPWQWKGQTPKSVTEARARAALSSDELAAVDLPRAEKLQHNVWDAIGIGLWRLGRMG